MSTTKPLSTNQRFAAWKAARRAKERTDADKRVAEQIKSGHFKGCKQGMGRGWKKWADKITS